MTLSKYHSARRIAINTYAAKKRVVKEAAEKDKRFALTIALKKSRFLERDLDLAVARADHFHNQYVDQYNLRIRALAEKRRVIHEYTGAVPQVEHEKFKKSFKIALQKWIVQKKKADERNKIMHKQVDYAQAVCKAMTRRRKGWRDL